MYEIEAIYRKGNIHACYRVYKDGVELDNVIEVDASEYSVCLTLEDGTTFPVQIDKVRYTYE